MILDYNKYGKIWAAYLGDSAGSWYYARDMQDAHVLHLDSRCRLKLALSNYPGEPPFFLLDWGGA